MFESKIKTINKFELYNDVWYKSCFHHSLAQIAKRENMLIPLYVNDVFSYEYNYKNEEPRLYFKVFPQQGWRSVFEDYNITVEEIITSENNIICDIKRTIDDNKPILIFIDLFYLKRRQSDDPNGHHAVVIYGYNDNEKLFNIINHNYINSLKYVYDILTYEEIENMYKGYAKNSETLSFFSFCNNTESDIESFNNKLQSIKNHDNYIRNNILNINLEHFKDFITDYEVFLYKLLGETSYKDRLIIHDRVFNDIMQVKKVQRHVSISVFGEYLDSEYLSENYLNEWYIVIGIICKCEYSKLLSEVYINKIITRLNHLYEIEESAINKAIEKYKAGGILYV